MPSWVRRLPREMQGVMPPSMTFYMKTHTQMVPGTAWIPVSPWEVVHALAVGDGARVAPAQISNSSVAEQMAVNHRVVGSNPTWGVSIVSTTV